MADNFSTIKLEVLTIADASAQLIDFYDRHARGKRIVFPIDYSLISGYIRPPSIPKPTPYDRGFDRDIDHIGRRIFQLYAAFAQQTPYKIAFSPPTILEFETSSSKIRGDIATVLNASGPDFDTTYDSVMRYVDSKGAPAFSSDDRLYKRAKAVFDTVSRTFGASPANELLHLINSGYVKGLGSFYSKGDFTSLKQEIYSSTKAVWDYLNKYRSTSDSHYFNNLIDALNFSITYHFDKIQNGVSLSYVAPFPDVTRHSRLDPAHKAIEPLVARRAIPATLLLDLSSRYFMARSAKPEANSSEWVVACFDRARTCREYIKDVDSPSDMSEPRQREINLFYKEYMIPTFKNGRVSAEIDSTFSEAKSFFSDREAFKRRFEESAATHEALEIGLQALEPVIESEELLSDMGLMDDPRILAIRNNLNKRSPS